MDKETFLSLALSRYEELEQLKAIDNFYDYEKSFDILWQDLGRQYLESFLQEASSNFSVGRKKKR